MQINTKIKNYLEQLIYEIQKTDIENISSAAKTLINAVNLKGNIYIFGNGGSASTAAHFHNDFNTSIPKYINTKFNVFCISDNIPSITAIANDFSYEDIFYLQLKDKLQDNDIVFAISCSGNSKNIIKAVKYAKKINAAVIGMTGFDGGALYKLADCNLHVPCNDMQRIEDMHLIFTHILMRAVIEHFTSNKE